MNRFTINRAARDLHDYVAFRARHEHQSYGLSPEFFVTSLTHGCRVYFGIEIDDRGAIAVDRQNPRALSLWRTKETPSAKKGDE